MLFCTGTKLKSGGYSPYFSLYAWQAISSWESSILIAPILTRRRATITAGTASPAKMPMIVITTNISTRVKPRPARRLTGMVLITNRSRQLACPTKTQFALSPIHSKPSMKHEAPSLECRVCNMKHATPSRKPGARNTPLTGAVGLPSPLSSFIMHILGKTSSWLGRSNFLVKMGKLFSRRACPPRCSWSQRGGQAHRLNDELLILQRYVRATGGHNLWWSKRLRTTAEHTSFYHENAKARNHEERRFIGDLQPFSTFRTFVFS